MLRINLKGIRILIHASTWFAPILCPFIIYLTFKEQDIQRLSLQAMVFHVVFVVLILVSFVLSFVPSFVLIGIPLLIVFWTISIVTPIVGIVYAIQDRHFSYPIIGRFIH